jgi:hypothetical protein
MTTPGADWAPSACTLPTAERPLRIAEFDELFAAAGRRVERIAPTKARVALAEAGGTRARAEDLAARETACCSFFAFTIVPAGPDGLWLEIEVPPEHIPVLDGLLTRVAS